MSSLKKHWNHLRFLMIAPHVNYQDKKLQMDIERWKSVLNLSGNEKQVLKQLLSNYKEFRNLFVFRNTGRRHFCLLIKMLYPPLDSLYIMTSNIGGGLFIQHGFSTYIAAETIGENCWINQQVTIGYRDNTTAPVIGNNVTITCGAKVLGPITVGDNAIIGANAVVIKDVEPRAVMGGVPAHIIKRLP